ncbi:MAG: hypothetical protein IKL88_01520 [Erysipelotrichales bacterium]|nr:hypothetical protein [Erysipelotrichales bacterium]
MVKNKQSIVGIKFGDLTVLEPTDKRKYRNIIWKCRSDSGEIVEKTRKELYLIKKSPNTYIEMNGHKFIDISGQRFGKLVAISFSERINGVTYWKCKCDCGNDSIVSYTNLTQGSTKSCGCGRLIKYKDIVSSNTYQEKRIHTIKAYISKS